MLKPHFTEQQVILSQTTEYALRATLYIAARHPVAVRASELAAALELPRNYLGKTLGRLVQAGVLSSARGTTGGFRLVRAPESLRLSEITRPFETNEPRRCLLGIGPCGLTPQCAVHRRWLPAALEIDRFFATTRIADLVAEPTPSPTADRAPATSVFLTP